MVRPADAPTRRRAVAWAVALAVLPWLWFVVRDRFGALTDVVAIGIPVLAAAVVVASVLVARRRRAALVLAASTLLAATAAVVGPWLPADLGAVAGPGLTVAGANVDNGTAAEATLRGLSADVLVVAEVPRALADGLGAEYPHRFDAEGGGPRLAVLSRYPLQLLEDSSAEFPGLRVEVDAPTGPVVLYALHIPRPWFLPFGYETTVTEHYRFTERIAERVRAETLPTVVVGDLNSTDRGRDYRALVRPGVLADAMLDTWAAPTSVGKWLPLLGRIDHVLVTEGWCGDDPRRVELPASSHRAVVATVGPCA